MDGPSAFRRKTMSNMGTRVTLSYLIRVFMKSSILKVDPLFIWSPPPYHSCEASACPAIILPSTATDWPDCGHPFVSFQMTIKMGATAEDSRTGNRQTFGHRSSERSSRLLLARLGWYWKPSPPPLLLQIPPPSNCFPPCDSLLSRWLISSM